jgi:predicted DNA-binding transcriptional regulator YafY
MDWSVWSRLSERSVDAKSRTIGSVGTRSASETIVAILKAFLDQRTWKQAELARHVGVQSSVVQRRLSELQQSGQPLHSERDHPHVYWSVPKSWFPGGVLFSGEQLTELFRQVSRMPKSSRREQLVATLLQYLPDRKATAGNIVPFETSPREERYLPIIEDAASGTAALRFSYFSASRGKESTRHASVQRVLPGPPARFVAICHRSGELKWFRIANVTDAKIDPSEAYRTGEPSAIDAYLRQSLDGFHSGGVAEAHVFSVRDPEARWVARNLLDEMSCEEEPSGIRVTARTSALDRLARYVVALGGSATPLTAALRAEVRALAQGALAACERAGES